ncbi:MAG: AraC family transcriptional regulator [Candidatus Scatosoma sp.]
MEYIEIEESEKLTDHEMNMPHSHEYYELYFLLEGEREFFIDNKMFVVPQNTLVIVPPYSMHKTAGGPYRRVNINVSSSLLSEYESDFLKKISRCFAVEIEKNYLKTVTQILNVGAEIQSQSLPEKRETLLSLAKTVIQILARQNLKPLSCASTSCQPGKVSSDILKIIYYINTNYTKNISLKEISGEFFLSKTTLCKQFKEVMHCGIMKYVTSLRINKAKELMIHTDYSMEDVAAQCGFSSANYFGLTFKKDTGMSPYHFKKTR